MPAPVVYRLPPRSNNGTDFSVQNGAQRPAGSQPLAFLEFVTCSLCATPFHATDQHQQRRFYMTSCGHVLCDDTSHNRVAYTLLEEGLSPSLLRWFQPAAQSFEGIGESFSVLKFQHGQLVRLTRSQRQRLEQYQSFFDEVKTSLESFKASEEDLKRQVSDLSRQLGEARAQNDALQQQNGTLKQKLTEVAASRTMGLPAHAPQMQETGIGPLQNGMVPQNQNPFGQPQQTFPSGMNNYKNHGQNEQPFHDPSNQPLKRPRDDGGFPFGRPNNPEYPQRSSTALPSGNRNVTNAAARPHSAASYGSGPLPGPRTNLEQYRFRANSTSAPTSLPQPPPGSRPSFSLARPTNGVPRWNNGGGTASRTSFGGPSRYNDGLAAIREGDEAGEHNGMLRG
ncbi:uncharacterized protein EHS24_008445 [Apiotrichum porosum]|uniref:Uncharacterized protein n=1 Tax=Apiotrichum porosum TaxID=105984 RepID=A0A427XQB9_9TREE|nr:uncharacterized protein EHS24_008445 [Apiotrichum porosum]RSH81013.1 hypothetical protein EHS24_008445 [Apiotrichum porosum]